MTEFQPRALIDYAEIWIRINELLNELLRSLVNVCLPEIVNTFKLYKFLTIFVNNRTWKHCCNCLYRLRITGPMYVNDYTAGVS